MRYYPIEKSCDFARNQDFIPTDIQIAMSDNSVLISILSAIGGLIVGLLMKVAEPMAISAMFGPDLRIGFRPDGNHQVKTRKFSGPTVYHQSLANRPPIAQQAPSWNVTYVRVRVWNEKTRYAKGCRGFLVNVEAIDNSGRFVPTGYCDSIQLKWSYLPEGSPQLVDLPKGVNQYLDVIEATEDRTNFTPCTVSMPSAYDSIFDKTGVFRFTIVVTAEETEPQEIKLQVSWNGIWSEINVQQTCIDHID